MLQKNTFLRKVEIGDMDLLFEWVNNEEVRKNAFHTEPITYEEHQKWFEELLSDRNQLQFIMLQEDKPIGQIRLTIHMEEAEIDYSIAPDKRGMGYGRELIHLILEKIYKEYTFIKKLTAKVKPENVASIDCFQKNGFFETYYQYEYEMTTVQSKKSID